MLFRVSQDVRLSNELGMAILQTPAGDLSLIYAVHITYVHKKHLNPHKGYRVVLNGSSKGSTKIAALNDDTGLVYRKLFGIKQVLEDHNPLSLDSLWALHIAFSPIQQPRGSGTSRTQIAHIKSYMYICTLASFVMSAQWYSCPFSPKLQFCSKTSTVQQYFLYYLGKACPDEYCSTAVQTISTSQPKQTTEERQTCKVLCLCTHSLKVEDSLFLSSFLFVLLVPFLLLQCWIVVSLHLKLGL